MIDKLIEKHNNGREYLKKNLSDLGYEYEEMRETLFLSSLNRR